jgi:para-nitrobenzyl esterase
MGCDLVIGTARDEMAAFYATNDRVKNATLDDAISSLSNWMSEAEARAIYMTYAKRRASDSPVAILGDIFTDRTFRSKSLDLAHRYSANGHSVYVYRFDRQSPAGLGACHCLDIPFVFSNLSDWEGSPMLNGVNAPASQQRVKRYRGHGQYFHLLEIQATRTCRIGIRLLPNQEK